MHAHKDCIRCDGEMRERRGGLQNDPQLVKWSSVLHVCIVSTNKLT